MKKWILIFLICILCPMKAEPSECPNIKTPYGYGFFTAIMAVDSGKFNTRAMNILYMMTCNSFKEVGIQECKSGFTKALENKSYAFGCLADLLRMAKEERESKKSEE